MYESLTGGCQRCCDHPGCLSTEELQADDDSGRVFCRGHRGKVCDHARRSVPRETLPKDSVPGDTLALEGAIRKLQDCLKGRTRVEPLRDRSTDEQWRDQQARIRQQRSQLRKLNKVVRAQGLELDALMRRNRDLREFVQNHGEWAGRLRGKLGLDAEGRLEPGVLSEIGQFLGIVVNTGKLPL